MGKRLTTEEFIEKARAVHGDRYDYSRVEYAHSNAEVSIICPDHGLFLQTPHSHVINKRGCSDCSGKKRLTTKTFIEKAKAVHGDRYDYCSVNYINNSTKITIICREHGPFLQTPSSHISKTRGCIDCAGLRKLTSESFVEKAKAIHGNRYDYSQVEYVNMRTKVTIVCDQHGAFEVLPNTHLKGHSCRACGYESRRSLRDSTDRFVEKAKAIHGNLYDYSLVDYVNNHTPVTIVCPIHGAFDQWPSTHIRNHGCPDCGSNRLTTELFIDRAKEVHGDRYDYSMVAYVNNRTPVEIICPDHGEFSQTPNIHLDNRSGCPDCGGTKALTTESFIERARDVHGDRYDYSQVEYVNILTPVTIICADHGPFEQLPQVHYLVGSGCSDCATSGFNPNDTAILYYLAISNDDGDIRYKVGITNRTIEERFRPSDLKRICVVRTWRYAIGREAAKREAEILRQFAGDKYTGPPILLSGNTELFTHDVLGLDK